MTGKYNKILRIIFALLFSLTIISCSDEKEEFTDDTTTDNSSTGGDNTTTKLSAPTGLSTVGSAGQVILNWTTLSGASNYTVFWDNSTGVSSSSNVITSVSNDNYTHSSLDNGTTYYYKVAGVNSYGTGTLSSEVSASTPLPAPANLSATAGYKQIALAWDNVSGASSYTVYWDNATGVSTSSSAITDVSDDNYTHTGLTGGATYYYKVAAVNSSGTGTLSTEANATAGSSQLMGGSMQGKELNLTTKVTTFAGTRSGNGGSAGDTNNDNGSLAKFWKPREMTTDGTNLYVAESTGHKIRQVVISTTAVSKLAGKYGGGVADGAYNVGSFFYPNGVTTDGTNVYVAMGSIRKIVISTKVTSTLISGLADVLGITTDGTNLYITDKGDHIVEKVVISSLQRSTIAGTGSSGSNDNATGTSASFNQPRGIITDGTNLYVADYANHKIRKIVISTGAVSTLAGSGTAGSADNTDGALATFNNPAGITTDGTNLYVTEYTGRKIRKIVISSGVVTTIAGSGSQGSLDRNTGTSATFRGPWGITTDGTYLYVAESSHLIRRIE
mgnify:CR=1 FL=1